MNLNKICYQNGRYQIVTVSQNTHCYLVQRSDPVRVKRSKCVDCTHYYPVKRSDTVRV